MGTLSITLDTGSGSGGTTLQCSKEEFEQFQTLWTDGKTEYMTIPGKFSVRCTKIICFGYTE